MAGRGAVDFEHGSWGRRYPAIKLISRMRREVKKHGRMPAREWHAAK
jgi:hypothetical protein